MSVFLHLLTLILIASITATLQATKTKDLKGDDINVFLTMAWQVAGHLRPNSSCYVCALMPYTAAEGLPLMALPASDCDTCHLMHIHLANPYSHPDCPNIKMRPLDCTNGHGNCNRCVQKPKPVPIVIIPRKFTWCLENDGQTPVGYSDCLSTFKWSPGRTGTEWKSLNSAPHQCLEAAGEARLSALAHRTASCSISSPVGMYWVCGNLAYPYLPADYKGRCGLAYVVPAMRVAHSLPKKLPATRARRGVSDIFGTRSISLASSSFLISAMVLGPFLSLEPVLGLAMLHHLHCQAATRGSWLLCLVAIPLHAEEMGEAVKESPSVGKKELFLLEWWACWRSQNLLAKKR
ncbi:unnamed protein product [Menidia menidia]|uniref:(Atlantic silverside) hypothetical protein n=1 Tax=Menidia menidia TaxID=238744 RepID=A0A8S4A9Z2_9TELE|nr:unnamed protein product [Menidia menidia]